MKACYNGGVRIFEYTQRGESAFEVFQILQKYKNENCPDLLLGIGSILDAANAAKYIAISADFIVSPIVKLEISEVCNKNGVLWIPGCATLTEINYAEMLGAELIKLFPGNILGPDFVKAALGPMPWLKLMPTGGVEPTEESLKKWFSAGVKSVGMGSQLLSKEMISNRDFKSLEELIVKCFVITSQFKK